MAEKLALTSEARCFTSHAHRCSHQACLRCQEWLAGSRLDHFIEIHETLMGLDLDFCPLWTKDLSCFSPVIMVQHGCNHQHWTGSQRVERGGNLPRESAGDPSAGHHRCRDSLQDMPRLLPGQKNFRV